MADALVSPAVGGALWAATLGVAAYSVRKAKADIDDKKIPLMGVMAAFVFAAQMINFSIPGTGSSGHLGGGLLLAAILGPYAGFLAMSSVLAIQALFFADGGLLAYGCNVFNLGFFTCFIAYPLIYKKMTGNDSSKARSFAAAMIAAVAGLQMGAFGVVLETLLSGKTELPFGAFVALMQPIHLAIGIVEGFVTAAVIAYVRKVSPRLLDGYGTPAEPAAAPGRRKAIGGLAIAALAIGIGLSWFASANPDGLEWSMERTSGSPELEATGRAYETAATIQAATAFLPDYGFKASGPEESAPAWPAVDAGTSLSGILGGAMALGLSALAGFAAFRLRRRTARRARSGEA
jgi:cobalt/nickel transport system permease protein